MREEDIETAIKVVIVGNGAVGKSSMIQRYCKGMFTKDYKKTIGVDFLERQINVGAEDVRLMLWDTAGQEEFDAITKAYYRGAQACVLVFSMTDRASFEAIESWRKKVEAEVGEIPTMLVQNKIDLVDDAVVTNEEVDALVQRLRFPFYRTSVKEDYNVNEVFHFLAERYLVHIQNLITQEEEEAVTAQRQPNRIGMFSSSSHNGIDTKSSRQNHSTTIQLGPGLQPSAAPHHHKRSRNHHHHYHHRSNANKTTNIAKCALA